MWLWNDSPSISQGAGQGLGFLGGSVVKNPPAMRDATGDAGSIPGSGEGPAGGHGNPLQYSCLENPMVLGAWWATVPRVPKSQTRLSMHTRKARRNPGFQIPSPFFFPLQHMDFPATYSFFFFYVCPSFLLNFALTVGPLSTEIQLLLLVYEAVLNCCHCCF